MIFVITSGADIQGDPLVMDLIQNRVIGPYW